ncbi:chitinase-like protein 3, partial [Gigantopelta aegis]|uniref:chitinase-like protein 3 n=1 Tax=Gigantopelta aegis TaxID=1735272 RepID=UPI001B8893BD
VFVTSGWFCVVCYFTNWSGDLLIPGAHFEISDINPKLCTHLMFAFAKIDTQSFQLHPTRTDDQGESGELGRYIEFSQLKRKNPKLLTMLSVGGSLQANAGFGEIVTSEEGRRLFAKNCVGYLRKWGFDGIDLDWEYPGDPPETKRNFTILIQDIRQVIEDEPRTARQKKLLMSLAAPVSEDKITRGYEVEKVASIVDFINLMAYDFHGPWNQITGLNAPLYPREGDWRFTPDLNVVSAVKTWTDRGAPREKIVLGFAGYGSSYTLNNTAETSVGAAVADVGRPGPYRLMKGQLSYYEICILLQDGATYQWDDLQKNPYVYINDTWVGFDDEHSIDVKVDWIIEQQLGGVMFWSLDLDDFKGSFCNKGKYPLLRAIVTAVARHYPDVVVPPYENTTEVTTSSITTPKPVLTSVITTPTHVTIPSTRTTEEIKLSTQPDRNATVVITPRIIMTQRPIATRKTTVDMTSPRVTTHTRTPSTVRSQMTSASTNVVVTKIRTTAKSEFEVETPIDRNLPPWIPDKNDVIDNSGREGHVNNGDDHFDNHHINSVAAESGSGGVSLTAGVDSHFSTELWLYCCIILYTFFYY